MNNQVEQKKPASLCGASFRVVADTAASSDNPFVDLHFKAFALGPYYDAKNIFGQDQGHLIEHMSEDGSGQIIVRVHKNNLLLLAHEMTTTHNITIPSVGQKNETRVGYQNGKFTPCDTPYDAMKMAYDHF